MTELIAVMTDLVILALLFFLTVGIGGLGISAVCYFVVVVKNILKEGRRR